MDQYNYEEIGIKCNPTLKLKIIPDLVKDGYLELYKNEEEMEL